MNDELVLNLRQADSLESEYQVLLAIKEALAQRSDNMSPLGDDLINPLESYHELISASELYCHLGALYLSDVGLKFLLCHVFGRRFGWSEHQDDFFSDRKTGVVKGLSSKQSSLDCELKVKGQINSILDDIINLLLEEKLSLILLAGLQFAVLDAHNKPVVRNRTVIHLMDWMKQSEEDFAYDMFLLIKDIVVAALTDIWSVIRNSCVLRLSHIVEKFDIQQLQEFFLALVMICKDSERGWQAREGAVMGISCVIRRFRWIGLILDDHQSQEILKSKMECILKFGKEEMSMIPEFISDQMPQLVYKLLADPQLTVREHTIKAYSLYISRSEFREVMSSFSATVSQLCPETQSLQESANPRTSLSPQQYHLLVLNPSFRFLDACLSEGLLGLCVHLVKHFPPGDLLSKWNDYFYAFNLHLMHPASTVRQATSIIFKFIVAKNTGSPATLKLVLLSLVSCWFPSLLDLTKDLSFNNETQNLSLPRISVTDLGNQAEADESSICMAWQWREGRLLAYELIFQFLIKNHWLYTFGSVYQSESESAGTLSSNIVKPSRSHHYSFSGKGTKNLQKQMQSFTAEESFGSRRCCRSRSFTSLQLTPGMRWDVARFALANTQRSANSLDESAHVETESKTSEFTFTAGRSRLTHPRYSISVAGPVRLMNMKADSDESEPSKRQSKETERGALKQRRESVSSYDAASLHRLGRRSLCTRASQMTSSAKNVSLLLLCFIEDNDQCDADKMASGKMDKDIPLAAASHGMELFQSDKLHSLLRIIFLQCVESLADSQWELRRMGHQLLPCVVEVIRWFDMSLLVELCDMYFTGQTTLLNYGMSLAVKYSMSHAADLIVMLNCSSHLWQESTMCQEVVENITKPVQVKLSLWCSAASLAISRPIVDRITFVAVEILMLGVIHFDSSHLPEESDKDVCTVLSVIASIFCQANTQTELASNLIHSHWCSEKQIVPFNGFLSCCTKQESSLHTFSSQAEKAFLCDIKGHLPLFSSKLNIQQSTVVLPIFALYLLKYADDDVLSKALSESIASISLTVNRLPSKNESGVDQAESVQWCLHGLCSLIISKQTDQTSLQNSLVLYRNLMLAFSPTKSNVSVLLRAIITRLKKVEVVDVKPGFSSFKQGKTCLTYTDLTLLSNDIPSLPLEPNALHGTDDEEDDDDDDALDHSDPRLMWETQVLSSSVGSGLGLCPRAPAFCGASLMPSNGLVCGQRSKDSEGSDWDQWSNEDEEDDTEITHTLQQFLGELEEDFTSRGVGNILEESIQHLPEDEKHVINSLV